MQVKDTPNEGGKHEQPSAHPQAANAVGETADRDAHGGRQQEEEAPRLRRPLLGRQEVHQVPAQAQGAGRRSRCAFGEETGTGRGGGNARGAPA
eukprot:7391978-Prymnesium_polylepis.1